MSLEKKEIANYFEIQMDEFNKLSVEIQKKLTSYYSNQLKRKSQGKIENWKNKIKQNLFWFDYEEIEGSDNNEVYLYTRQHGDVGMDKTGEPDVKKAIEIAGIINMFFPSTQYRIEEVDEWVYLYLMPSKRPTEILSDFIKEEEDKKKQNIAKKVSKLIDYTEKEVLKILNNQTLKYAKEYYEKNKSSSKNDFRIFYSQGKPMSVNYNSVDEIFKKISEKQFVEDFYDRPYEYHKFLVGFYNWDALSVELNKKGRPVKEDGETDYRNEGITIITLFGKQNIKDKADFVKKVSKIISDFKIIYNNYILEIDVKKDSPKSNSKKSYNDAIDGILQLIEVTDEKNKLYKKYVDALAGLKELRDSFGPETKTKKTIKKTDKFSDVKKDFELFKKSNIFSDVFYKNGVITIDGGQEWLVPSRDRYGVTYDYKYSDKFFETPQDIGKAFDDEKIKGGIRRLKYYIELDKTLAEPEPDDYGDTFDDKRKSYTFTLKPVIKDGKMVFSDVYKDYLLTKKYGSLEKRIELLKKEYGKLYYSKYPSKAKRYGFKHKSFLGYDRYGDLYFYSDFPREFRHPDEYGGLSEAKENILNEVEEWEFEVDKLFEKYKVPHNSHAN